MEPAPPDFEAEVAALDSTLAEIGVPVFPAMPQITASAIAEWPNADWRNFLRFAAAVAPLLYRVDVVLDQADADTISFDAIDAEPEAATILHRAAALAHSHVGEVVEVKLAFARGGILHRFAMHAPWRSAFDNELDVLRLRSQLAIKDRAESQRAQRAAAASDWAAIEAHFEEWVTVLAEDRGFLAADNDPRRRSAAASALPELGRLLAAPTSTADGQRERSFGLRILAAALATANDTVRPRLEREALAGIDSIVDAVRDRTDFAAARRADQRERIVRTVVREHLGFKSSSVSDAVIAFLD